MCVVMALFPLAVQAFETPLSFEIYKAPPSVGSSASSIVLFKAVPITHLFSVPIFTAIQPVKASMSSKFSLYGMLMKLSAVGNVMKLTILSMLLSSGQMLQTLA